MTSPIYLSDLYYECWDDEEIPWPGPYQEMSIAEAFAEVTKNVKSFGSKLIEKYLESSESTGDDKVIVRLETARSYHAPPMSIGYSSADVTWKGPRPPADFPKRGRGKRGR